MRKLNIPKTRPVQKQRCKLSPELGFCCSSLLHYTCVCFPVDRKQEEGRPSFSPKLSTSSSVPELGHSSSSEGEKDFSSPEWDFPVPVNGIRKSKPEAGSSFQPHPTAGADQLRSCASLAEAGSLQQISLQTINAEPFLKKLVPTGTCSPPPTSPSLLPPCTYSSVVNTNRYPHAPKAFPVVF